MIYMHPVCQLFSGVGKTVRSLENMPYLSASEVMIHEEALCQEYVPLPLCLCFNYAVPCIMQSIL